MHCGYFSFIDLILTNLTKFISYFSYFYLILYGVYKSQPKLTTNKRKTPLNSPTDQWAPLVSGTKQRKGAVLARHVPWCVALGSGLARGGGGAGSDAAVAALE